MKVKVKFFAALRDRVGAAEVIKDMPEGCTVGELWKAMQQDYPRLAGVDMKLLFAVNREYVKSGEILKENDEVVFVPPVSGG